MKKFIALLAALSLHFSICTGGSFSLITAYANSFAEHEVFMSHARADSFLCRTFTPADLQAETSSKSSCSNAGECLVQTISRKRQVIVSSDDLRVDAVPERIADVFDTDSLLASAVNLGNLQSNSVYGDPRLLTRSLYKRE